MARRASRGPHRPSQSPRRGGSMRLVKVGLASVNATVGSVDSNSARIVRLLDEMAADGVTVACFPEQVIGGYPSEDLVQWRGFVAAQWRALGRVAAATGPS